MGEEIKYMNIKIRKETGHVEVFFTDEKGKEIAPDEERPVSKEPVVIDKKVKYIDRATWWLQNPTGCVWYDKRLY